MPQLPARAGFLSPLAQLACRWLGLIMHPQAIPLLTDWMKLLSRSNPLEGRESDAVYRGYRMTMTRAAGCEPDNPPSSKK